MEPISYAGLGELALEVMKSAEKEAKRFGDSVIHPAYILMGIFSQEGRASAALVNIGINPLRVEKMLSTRIHLTKSKGDGLTLSAPALRVIGYAREEARNAAHNKITPQDLLIGIMMEYDGYAWEVLVKLGARIERLRDALAFRISTAV